MISSNTTLHSYVN